MTNALILGAILLAGIAANRPVPREPVVPSDLSGPVVIDERRFVDPYPGRRWVSVH